MTACLARIVWPNCGNPFSTMCLSRPCTSYFNSDFSLGCGAWLKIGYNHTSSSGCVARLSRRQNRGGLPLCHDELGRRKTTTSLALLGRGSFGTGALRRSPTTSLHHQPSSFLRSGARRRIGGLWVQLICVISYLKSGLLRDQLLAPRH